MKRAKGRRVPSMRPPWQPVPDRVLAEHARVEEYRDDGFFKVVGDPSDSPQQIWSPRAIRRPSATGPFRMKSLVAEGRR